MIYNRKSRRAFLQGTGGLLFSIPFLQSFAEQANAQAAVKKVKRMVSFYVSGGSAGSIWFPNLPATAFTTIGTGYKALRISDAITKNGMVSPIFSDSRFVQYANQLNLYRGLDMNSFTGHTKTGALAAEAAGDRTTDIIPAYPSIDYLVSRSGSVYETEPQSRLTVLGVANSSNNWNGPSTSFSINAAGTVSVIPPILNPIAAFDHFFKDLVVSGGAEGLAKLQMKRKSVLDTVVEDYNRLMKSGRLAASEKSTLESHIDNFRDLEKKITGVRVGACSALPSKPNLGMFSTRSDDAAQGWYNPGDLELVMNLMVDIAATALRCQLTQVVTIMLDAGNLNLPGLIDAHRLSHSRVSENEATRKDALDQTTRLQSIYISKVLRLVDQLNIDEPSAAGEKMLDNTLILGTNEMGTVGNHRSYSMPVFTIGGGARLNTGWYIDYRNANAIPSNYADTDVYPGQSPEYFGRDYNSFLVGAMTSMGLNSTAWERNGVAGFGSYKFIKDWYQETTNPSHGLITLGRRSPPPFMLKA